MKKLIIRIPNKLYENIKQIKKDFGGTYSDNIGLWIDWYIVNMFLNFHYTKKEWIKEYYEK